MRRLAKTPPPQAERRLDARLPQIESVRLYRQIADLLSERIDQGLFPIGTLLPAERELAQQLGVSRTSVREALIALEVGGKVSIRVGHGVQILEATPRPSRRRGDDGLRGSRHRADSIDGGAPAHRTQNGGAGCGKPHRRQSRAHATGDGDTGNGRICARPAIPRRRSQFSCRDSAGGGQRRLCCPGRLSVGLSLEASIQEIRRIACRSRPARPRRQKNIAIFFRLSSPATRPLLAKR